MCIPLDTGQISHQIYESFCIKIVNNHNLGKFSGFNISEWDIDRDQNCSSHCASEL